MVPRSGPKPLCYSLNVLADSYIVPECIVRPGSLGGLMSLYESNDIKLRALVPAIPDISGEHVSRTPQDLDLHLRVDGATRYTLDLRLTYLFGPTGHHDADPDLRLRVYLDARMVEVMSWAVTHRHEALRALAVQAPRELDRRWSRNIMLGKWLDYLAERGHRFGIAKLSIISLPARGTFS